MLEKVWLGVKLAKYLGLMGHDKTNLDGDNAFVINKRRVDGFERYISNFLTLKRWKRYHKQLFSEVSYINRPALTLKYYLTNHDKPFERIQQFKVWARLFKASLA